LLAVDAPEDLGRYVISKGSIAIDGISLTIARLDGVSLGLQIIPSHGSTRRSPARKRAIA
jgi:riboflavin synthase